ncbi:MAG TPA: hypothetical protein VGB97_01940 [Candidatus Paceibacterota bacterium]|jgi:hypothetical protein
MQERGGKIIRNASVQLAIIFPFIWFVLLSIQAVREGTASIYLEMGWLAVPLSLLMASDSFVRYTKIDFENKTISTKDGIGNKTILTEGSLLRIIKKGSAYDLVYSENGVEKTVRWSLFFYAPKKQKMIVETLLAFNPRVVK